MIKTYNKTVTKMEIKKYKSKNIQTINKVCLSY